jgi:hypothetical protein
MGMGMGYGWGGKYGKSAYMLVYERRRKKDVKMVVPEEKVEEERQKNIVVDYDEEKKEYTKMVDYRASVDPDEPPNRFYEKVYEDNRAFTFESDIYSNEFFKFIFQILTSASNLGENSNELKLAGLKIAEKAGFDILARCAANSGIADVAQVMIDILKSSDELCKTYMQYLLDASDAELIMGILIEGGDSLAQKHVARVIKYLLCRLKMLEKEDIEAETQEMREVSFTDTEGKR